MGRIEVGGEVVEVRANGVDIIAVLISWLR